MLMVDGFVRLDSIEAGDRLTPQIAPTRAAQITIQAP